MAVLLCFSAERPSDGLGSHEFPQAAGSCFYNPWLMIVRPIATFAPRGTSDRMFVFGHVDWLPGLPQKAATVTPVARTSRHLPLLAKLIRSIGYSLT
jgi:hypothetical protein